MLFRDLLDDVDERRRAAEAKGGSAYFRGQSVAEWRLWSRAHRYVNRVNAESGNTIPDADLRQLLREEQKSLFHRFKSASSPFLDPLQRTDWGYVFAMQHYGMPTRLLDWTKSFACALFFANADWDRKADAAVFLLLPDEVNQMSLKQDGEVILDCDLRETVPVSLAHLHPAIADRGETLSSAAVLPVYTNARMVVQQARFVICGDEFQPLEVLFPGAIHKYTLTPAMSAEIDKFLSLVGLDWASYFPDLEGLARQNRHREECTVATARRLSRRDGV